MMTSSLDQTATYHPIHRHFQISSKGIIYNIVTCTLRLRLPIIFIETMESVKFGVINSIKQVDSSLSKNQALIS